LAQDTNRIVTFGIGGQAQQMFHQVDLMAFPLVPDRPTQFDNLQETNFSFHSFIEFPFSRTFHGGLRLSFQNMQPTFLSNQATTFVDNGQDPIPGVIQHEASLDMSFVGLELFSKYEVTPSLAALLGVQFGAISSPTLRQKETIIVPDDRFFIGGSNSQEYYNGEVDISSPQVSLSTHLQYYMPLKKGAVNDAACVRQSLLLLIRSITAIQL
jgi:hypothetical protein